jgi:invasion protein IalB
MRDTVIGIVLAVLFLAGMFAAMELRSGSGSEAGQSASEVQPGFVGVKAIGPWHLTCREPQPGAVSSAKTPIPFSLNPNPRTAAAVAAAAADPFGRCRTVFILRRKDNPNAAILAVAFRYVQATGKLVLIVHFPAFAKAGDPLVLRLGKGGVRLQVNDCGANGCMSMGALSQQIQDLILASPSGVLVFPAKQNGKPLGMVLPFTGLGDALAAMRRAES